MRFTKQTTQIDSRAFCVADEEIYVSWDGFKFINITRGFNKNLTYSFVTLTDLIQNCLCGDELTNKQARGMLGKKKFDSIPLQEPI